MRHLLATIIVTVIGIIQALGADRHPFYRTPRFWAWTMLVLIGIVGIALSLPFYLPRIILDIPSSSLPAPQPLSFSVRNDGILPIHHVRALLFGIKVKTRFPNGTILVVHDSIIPYGEIQKVLAPGQHFNFAVRHISAPIVADSDIEAIVTFRPAFTWRRSYACSRFVLALDANNSLRWFHKEPYACDLAIRCAALHSRVDTRDSQHPSCMK
jgi:hypothetical protein